MGEKVEYTLGVSLSVLSLSVGIGLETLFRFKGAEYPVYCSPAAILPAVGASLGSYLDYRDTKVLDNYDSRRWSEKRDD